MEQRIAAESRAFDHGTQTLDPPSLASLAIEAKMMQDFRLASVLLVPFGSFFLGREDFPTSESKVIPHKICLFQPVAQPDGLDG